MPASLRSRQFLIFWLGTIFAWTGNQVLVWAIPWHARNFTANPIALGLIGLIRLAPTILFSLFAGMIADTFNRCKIDFITQAVMGITALVLVGASDSLSSILRSAIRQEHTTDRLRGRMTNINQIFFMGDPQPGELEAGVVAQVFGAPFAVITGGIGYIIATVGVA